MDGNQFKKNAGAAIDESKYNPFMHQGYVQYSRHGGPSLVSVLKEVRLYSPGPIKDEASSSNL